LRIKEQETHLILPEHDDDDDDDDYDDDDVSLSELEFKKKYGLLKQNVYRIIF
jgi:hypothetical protein